MYDHTLHRGKNISVFIRRNIKDCFKINGKQRIIMPKKGENVKFRNYERKIDHRL